MFTFYIENHEPFGSLTKNCPKLDKNWVQISVFVVYKSAVSTVQKATMWDVSIFLSKCLYLQIYFLIFQ